MSARDAREAPPMSKDTTVWVGYSDGLPHVWKDDRGVRQVAVYPSRRDARLDYEDVRPMRLVPRKKS